jgi:hypothetical protein
VERKLNILYMHTTVNEVQQPDGDRFLYEHQNPVELNYMCVCVCLCVYVCVCVRESSVCGLAWNWNVVSCLLRDCDLP